MEKFNFKKRYGQNFLQDFNVLNKIVSCVTLTDKDLVMEIGPGQGILTKKIQEYNPYLICFEIDKDTKYFLKDLENEKTIFVYEDFLKRNIKEDIAKIKYDNLYIIANLPYYITTPIIQKIIDSNIKPKSLVLMVQKEVAERFSAKAKTKNYGSLTVYLNYHFDITVEFIVKRNSFYPIPNVDSAVIKMQEKVEKPYLSSEKKFNEILKASFKQKRKTLRNNLGSETFEKILPILKKGGYSNTVRAEEISLETFIAITNYLNSQEK